MNESAKNSPNGAASNRAPDEKPVAPLIRLGDALGDFMSDAQAAHEARVSGQPRGPITGFPSLDRELGFALAPGLHGVYGNSGAGKTALCAQIAAQCGFPALYVTCEMGVAELLRRHVARETGTFLGRLKSGELSPDAAGALARETIGKLPQFYFLDATRATASPSHIRDCARIVKGAARGVLIVIDSLQSLAESLAPGEAEYDALNTAIALLRGVAHELSAPILFISERNRKGNEKTSGGLNSGAGTRKIEYGAETVLDLDRDMNAQESGAGEFQITARFAKNRHGSIGRGVPLLFNGALQKFREEETGARNGGRGA